MQYRVIWAVILIVLFLNPGPGWGLEPVVLAPAFHLTSGDGLKISLDQMKGNCIVIIYETRETVEQNRSFKNELRLFLAQSADVKTATTVLAVINCSSAIWPITKIWQARLRENSEKESLAIYGDLDGRLAADYGMQGL